MSDSERSSLVLGGFIDGQKVSTASTFAVINPATREEVGQVSDMEASHAQAAIDAAAAAFDEWRGSSSATRVTALNAWADAIDAKADHLASTVCAESGKPLREARGEIAQCAALLRWFAVCVPALKRETISESDLQVNETIRQPIGVVACITPWNFPAAAVIVKAGAAIAAGCTAVVKPSEETPLIALALAALTTKTELPNGAINVVPCADPQAVGDTLCQSPTVRMLSFTGSTRTGATLATACAATIKRMALELGGNAPFVVLDDADLDRAISGAVNARFYNSGQICVGANRFLVHEKIYDAFADGLAARVKAMTAGPGHADASDIGPMINDAAIQRLQYLVDNATAAGAQLVTGGSTSEDGRYFAPTVLTGMTPDMAAYDTEIFGPVACLYAFADESEALRLANDTHAGLSAYVYSENPQRVNTFVDRLEAGVVGANSTMIFANDLPFGGIKQSGIGREHGHDCLHEYTEVKSICRGAM